MKKEKKICPYNRRVETHVQRFGYNLTENGAVDAGTVIDQWLYEPDECYGERCGAYQNEACRYASVNLDNG